MSILHHIFAIDVKTLLCVIFLTLLEAFPNAHVFLSCNNHVYKKCSLCYNSVMNNVVDEYLSKLSEPQQSTLKHVQQVIQTTIPEAEQVITYGMPGYKYKGKYLISFSAFKDHLSVFPGAEAIGDLKEQLQTFEISKGTIQFTPEHPLPDDLLESIVMHGVARIDNAKK